MIFCRSFIGEGVMRSTAKTRERVRSIAYIALMTAVIAVCAWITVPFTVPFTMQTFGVMLALKTLGGKNGTVSVLLYIALGGIGVPVFSGFSGGPGVLFGPTGGYILGFFIGALIYRALEKHTSGIWGNIAVTALFLIVCYTFGTAWFIILMGMRQKPVGILSALSLCVVPYVIPDAIKLFLADRIGKRMGKYIH